MLFCMHAQRMLPIVVGVALLAPLTPARAQWEIQTVEEGPNQLGSKLDLAYDPSGNPAMAYGTGTAYGLRFAHFNGLSWDIEDIMACGGAISLAYSPQGAPSVTAMHGQPQAGFYFVSKSGARWSSTRLDTDVSGDDESSLLYDNADPAVCYRKGGKKPGLTVARRSSAGVWTKQTVDSGVAGRGYLAMALDAVGNLAIAYSHSTNPRTTIPDTLKFAHWNGSSWDIEVVESGTVGCGVHVTLAYDPITERPSVAHGPGEYPTSLGPVFLRKTESGTWERTLLDQTVTREVRGCSLVYRQDGTAYLAYGAQVTDPVAPYSMKVAWRDPSSGEWTIEVVEQPSDKATFSPSLKIDADGNLGLSYSQRTANSGLDARVKFATRQDQ